jgi:hypothetical protein
VRIGLSTRLQSALPSPAQDWQPLPSRALLYVRITALLGLIVLGVAIAGWDSPDAYRYLAFFGIAVIASGMRIHVPGLTGSLSLTFLFVLFGLVELTLSETILMAGVMTLIQCYWNQKKRPRPAKVVFNVAAMLVATAAAGSAFQSPWLAGVTGEGAARLAWATLVFFLANTAPLALVVALAESKPFITTWLYCDFWAFPYYLGGSLPRVAVGPVDWARGLFDLSFVSALLRAA